MQCSTAGALPPIPSLPDRCCAETQRCPLYTAPLCRELQIVALSMYMAGCLSPSDRFCAVSFAVLNACDRCICVYMNVFRPLAQLCNVLVETRLLAVAMERSAGPGLQSTRIDQWHSAVILACSPHRPDQAAWTTGGHGTGFEVSQGSSKEYSKYKQISNVSGDQVHATNSGLWRDGATSSDSSSVGSSDLMFAPSARPCTSAELLSLAPSRHKPVLVGPRPSLGQARNTGRAS